MEEPQGTAENEGKRKGALFGLQLALAREDLELAQAMLDMAQRGGPKENAADRFFGMGEGLSKMAIKANACRALAWLIQREAVDLTRPTVVGSAMMPWAASLLRHAAGLGSVEATQCVAQEALRRARDPVAWRRWVSQIAEELAQMGEQNQNFEKIDALAPSMDAAEAWALRERLAGRGAERMPRLAAVAEAFALEAEIGEKNGDATTGAAKKPRSL